LNVQAANGPFGGYWQSCIVELKRTYASRLTNTRVFPMNSQSWGFRQWFLVMTQSKILADFKETLAGAALCEILQQVVWNVRKTSGQRRDSSTSPGTDWLS
jgi:hypothetical protein